MTREQFINTLVGACANGSTPGFIREVEQMADLIYDPLLDDDDERQLRYAMRSASRRAEEMFKLADQLQATLKKAVPVIRRDRE